MSTPAARAESIFATASAALCSASRFERPFARAPSIGSMTTSTSKVETLRVAHILAVTEPDGFRQSIATVVEVLSEMDALRGIAAN